MKRHATLADLLGETPKKRRVGLGRSVLPPPKEEEKSVEQESEEETGDATQRNYLVKVS